MKARLEALQKLMGEAKSAMSERYKGKKKEDEEVPDAAKDDEGSAEDEAMESPDEEMAEGDDMEPKKKPPFMKKR